MKRQRQTGLGFCWYFRLSRRSFPGDINKGQFGIKLCYSSQNEERRGLTWSKKRKLKAKKVNKCEKWNKQKNLKKKELKEKINQNSRIINKISYKNNKNQNHSNDTGNDNNDYDDDNNNRKGLD